MTKKSNITLIEALEQRIAPAGLITATYVAGSGELTINGDAEANRVEIFQTGPETYRVIGTAATSINSAGTDFLDIGKLTKLTINGGDGADDFSLVNLRTLTSLTYNGGAGGDTLNATNLTVKGNVTLSGDAGNDTVNFDGVSTTITGNLTVDAAATAGDRIRMTLAARDVNIGGTLSFTGGGGDDRLNGDVLGTLRIGKGIQFTAGEGGGRVDLRGDGATTIGKLSSGESVIVTGGSGSDQLSLGGFSTTLAGSIRFTGALGNDVLNLGAGSDILKIGKLASGQSILLDGGDGNDAITLTGSKVTLTGAIDFIGGIGDNRIDLGAASGVAKIGKLASGESIRFTGGIGNDQVALNASTLTLQGGIRMSVDAGDNSLSISAASGKAVIGKLATMQSILFTGLGGADSIQTNLASLTLAGGIEVNGGDGANSLTLSGSNGLLKIGKLSGGQSILFTGGAGNDFVTSDVARQTLLGGIKMNGGGGNNVLEFDSRDLIKVGKFATGQSVSVSGTGDAENEVFFGGRSTLSGSIEVTSGSGGGTIGLDGITVVGRNDQGLSVSLNGGAGLDRLDFDDNVSLAGSLVFNSGEGNSLIDFTDLQTLGIRGAVQIVGGTGDDTVNVEAFRLTLGSTLSFTGGDGADRLSIIADGSIAGDVNVNLGASAAGTQRVILESLTRNAGGLALRGGLTVDAANAVSADAFTLTNVAVLKAIAIVLGEGVSTVDIDNLLAGDAFNLSTGGGNDVVNIERENLFGNSIIRKLASIQLGLGDDQIAIGNPVPEPNTGAEDSTRVNFVAGLTLDGGDGAGDNRNDIEGQNTFGAPLNSTGFELTTLV